MCNEDKASISRSIEFLEKNNLIICNSNKKKRYNSSFNLTERGLQIATSIATKIDSFLEIASNGLTENERIIMYKCLNLIDKNLENFCNNNYEN